MTIPRAYLLFIKLEICGRCVYTDIAQTGMDLLSIIMAVTLSLLLIYPQCVYGNTRIMIP
jgi:hypothetical protein